MCILCDSDLPDADGEAVVRMIRRAPSAVADAPFVLLVARGDTHLHVARFGAGHSSGSPAFRTPSNTAGQFGKCSIIDLTVNFGFRRRASAKEALASSILPASA